MYTDSKANEALGGAEAPLHRRAFLRRFTAM